MGIAGEFKRVKLFSGIIFKDILVCNQVKERLEDAFSQVDYESETIPFDSTVYYDDEMGTPLFRKFFSFEQLIFPQELPAKKRFTNQLEKEFSVKNKRMINIDPGYLSEANVIIATTKNYFHRVPLEDGIYAHMEYVIKKKKIVPLEWTYPDFRKKEYLHFFEYIRSLYKQKNESFLMALHDIPFLLVYSIFILIPYFYY